MSLLLCSKVVKPFIAKGFSWISGNDNFDIKKVYTTMVILT